MCWCLCAVRPALPARRQQLVVSASQSSGPQDNGKRDLLKRCAVVCCGTCMIGAREPPSGPFAQPGQPIAPTNISADGSNRSNRALAAAVMAAPVLGSVRPALADDQQGVASSRMSYSRFLEYLDMGRVKKVLAFLCSCSPAALSNAEPGAFDRTASHALKGTSLIMHEQSFRLAHAKTPNI